MLKHQIKYLTIHEEHENKSIFALFQDNIFEYQSYKAGRLDLSILNQQNLIILDGITNPTSGLINELKVLHRQWRKFTHHSFK